jgi:glycosyltransferase involved in cell wall biosynthesis
MYSSSFSDRDRQSISTRTEGCGTASPRPRVSLVIPARNEGRNIAGVLRALPACVDEVILVDGNSVDDTVTVALSVCPDIRVFPQSRPGKGNALATGFLACTGDYIVMIDADGSMDPLEIKLFIEALDDGAQFVKGSRFMAGGGSADITLARRLGNSGFNMITRLLFGTHYTDLCYGYNAFRADCLPQLGLASPYGESAKSRYGDGFEIETMMNIRAARTGLCVREVPSYESLRQYGQSNLRTFRDGARVLFTIIRERARGLRLADFAAGRTEYRGA